MNVVVGKLRYLLRMRSLSRTQQYLTVLWSALLDGLTRSTNAFRTRLRVQMRKVRPAVRVSRQHLTDWWAALLSIVASLAQALRGGVEAAIRRCRSAQRPWQFAISFRIAVLDPLTSGAGALVDRLVLLLREYPPRWTRVRLALLGSFGRVRGWVPDSWTHALAKLGVSPLGALTSVMNAVGTCLVLLVMFVILTDVIGRTLFRAPLRGTAEIVAMSIAAIVFLQFPSTLRAGRVIQTDGLLDWVGAHSVRAEQYLLAAYHVLGGVMFVIVCAFVSPMLLGVWEGREFYGNIGVFTFPKWPVFAVIAFGTAVMALQYFVLAIQYVRAGQRGRRLTEVDPATRVMS